MPLVLISSLSNIFPLNGTTVPSGLIMRASTAPKRAICGRYAISTSPYFLPCSVRILIRTYLATSPSTSSVRWIQSSTTAGASGAMATLFMANSCGVAFLSSMAKRDGATAATIRTIEKRWERFFITCS